MSHYLDSLLDAERRGDCAASDSEAAEQGAREEIAAAFSLMRTVPAKQLAVPCVEAKGSGLRVRSMSMAEAVRDLTMEGYGNEQLLAVLAGSNCPLVQKLRDELCTQWQRQWVTDIAEARS